MTMVHILYIIYVMYALYVNVCHVCNVCKVCNVCNVCNICNVCSGARRDHSVQAQDRRRIASYGATVIATCTHTVRAQVRKLECDRHRNLGAHCNRRITIASQVALRPSSLVQETTNALAGANASRAPKARKASNASKALTVPIL